MSDSPSDRELLIGVMAVQLGFASAQQVMAGAAEWATDRKRGLAERLQQRGAITEPQQKMLHALVHQAIAINAGDVRATIESLGGDPLVLQSLGGSMNVEQTFVRKREADDERTEPPGHSQEDLLAVSEEDPGRYTSDASADGAAAPVEIGRGGIGRVLVAFDQFLQREIAIKELLPERHSSGSGAKSGTSHKSAPMAQRFLREARVTGKLEHPNIVPVYELGRRKDGALYYTMKLVRGRTLAAVLSAAKTQQERFALLPHFLSICNALAYAHSRGVIHRDVKPQNVMIGEFGETVVLDWGLAKVRGKQDFGRGELKQEQVMLSGAHSIEGSAMGTPAYMSPEQAEGKVDEIDERSDVWALGAMLYEVLTGRPPFEGVNPYDVIGKLLQHPVTPVARIAPNAPVELATIAEKALQKSKADRYQTAKQFAADLQAWLSGARVAAHEYSSMELVRRFARRNRFVLSVMALAVSVVVVFLAFAYRRVQQERDAARGFAGILLSDVSEKLEPLPGSGPLLEKLTSGAIDYYRRTIDPASASASDRAQLARAYGRIGETAMAVGKYDEARAAFTFAQELLERVHTEQPNDDGISDQLAQARLRMGDTWLNSDDLDKAKAAFLSSLALAQELLPHDPTRFSTLDLLSRAYSRLGQTQQQIGDFAEAERLFRLAYENDLKLSAARPNDPALKRALAVDLITLGEVFLDGDQLAEAEKSVNAGLAITAQLVADDPQNRQYALDRSYLLNNAAMFAEYHGDQEELHQRQLAEGMRILQPLLKAEPDNVETLIAWETLLITAGRFSEAAQLSGQLSESSPVQMGADELLNAVAAGDTGRALSRMSKLPPMTGPLRTSVLAFEAAAVALSGDAKAAAKLAREASASAAQLGGVGRFPAASMVLKGVSNPRADAVRKLYADLHALHGARSKEGWKNALDAFARALDETP